MRESRKNRRQGDPERTTGPGVAPTAGGSDFVRLGSLLETVARRASRDRVSHDLWSAAVGPRIANRTAPGSLKNGLLTVTVTTSTWAQELTFLAETITERLRARGAPVMSLRFRVGKVESGVPTLAERRPDRPPAPLPEALKARLETLDDAELKEAIAAAAGYWHATNDTNDAD